MFRKILLLSAALAPCYAVAQSTPVTAPARLTEFREPAKDGSAAAVDVGRAGIGVSKTAFVDGENVCGEIRISNGTRQTATLNSIVDYLEVHFPRGATPPVPPPAGSTSNWFKVADVPIAFALPASIAPGASTTIPYCFSLCLAADSPGANSMRNVVTVTVTVSGLARAFTTRSVSFPPPVLDCQACCLPNGSCLDTVPARCASAGGLSGGTGTDCATTECTQACCSIDGTCSDEAVSECLTSGGAPRGLGTDCATANTTCRGACCNLSGNPACFNVSPAECELRLGTFLGLDTTCETEFAACPTGACCSGFGGCVDFRTQGLCEFYDIGTFLGVGTTCESDFAGPTGACCHGNGDCIDMTEGQCVICEEGTFHGLGTSCATANTTCRGACCNLFGTPACFNASPAECELRLGTFLGLDTTCETEFAACPTGACCSGFGGCVDFSIESECASFALGTFLGVGTTCGPSSCTEACCFSDGSCNDLLPGDCTGNPQGPGTNCSIPFICNISGP